MLHPRLVSPLSRHFIAFGLRTEMMAALLAQGFKLRGTLLLLCWTMLALLWWSVWYGASRVSLPDGGLREQGEDWCLDAQSVLEVEDSPGPGICSAPSAPPPSCRVGMGSLSDSFDTPATRAPSRSSWLAADLAPVSTLR